MRTGRSPLGNLVQKLSLQEKALVRFTRMNYYIKFLPSNAFVQRILVGGPKSAAQMFGLRSPFFVFETLGEGCLGRLGRSAGRCLLPA